MRIATHLRDPNNPGERYALNVWKGSSNYYNCDIHTITGNLEDSKLDLITVNGGENLYRVKLLNENMYLTAMGTGNGADVRWKALTRNDDQLWKLIEVTDGGETGEFVSIPMTTNINQKYVGHDSWIRAYGCAVCCGVDIASWTHNTHYTVDDMILNVDYTEDESGYQWSGPNGFELDHKENLAQASLADTIERIKYYLRRGVPVACHAVGANGAEHWFVAYGIVNGDNRSWETSGIKVMDPYNPNENDPVGATRTIADAMTKSMVTWGVDRIRICSENLP